MVDERTFFQIAAALIPVLLFGGVAFSRPQIPALHQRFTQGHWAFLALIGTVAPLALLAEVAAISAAVSADPSDFERYIVAAAILAGMELILLGQLLPWVRRAYLAAGQTHSWITRQQVLLTVLVTATAVGGVVWLGLSVEGAEVGAASKEIESTTEQVLANVQAIDRVGQRLTKYTLRSEQAAQAGHQKEARMLAELARAQREQLALLRKQGELLFREIASQFRNLPGGD